MTNEKDDFQFYSIICGTNRSYKTFSMATEYWLVWNSLWQLNTVLSGITEVSDKNEDSNVCGDDAFACLYAAGESDIEAALQKAKTDSKEKSMTSAVAIDAKIRQTKARLLDEVPRLQRLAVKRYKRLKHQPKVADFHKALTGRSRQIPLEINLCLKTEGILPDYTHSPPCSTPSPRRLEKELKKLKAAQKAEAAKLQIWDSALTPQAHKEIPLSEFFYVEDVACLALRRRKNNLKSSGQQIWKIIKENKDLDLPAHKVMVTTVFCEEIVKEKCGSFLENEEWHELQKTVQSRLVPDLEEA
ncbi:hypothetical protein ACH5RR_006007 [Cinchona calisaya]|uniref:Uncharacterized protein n=1 Tax=Cinchona calisaya TaxID=153742 RepID=A0ABD3AMS5_9GENT